MKSRSASSEKPYDLEERTYAFALECRLFLKETKWDPVSWPDVRQLLRSSGSVASNFVESIEAVSPDDRLYRLRLCKKESRESGLWLRLLEDCNTISDEVASSLRELAEETQELVRIFSSIIHRKRSIS